MHKKVRIENQVAVGRMEGQDPTGRHGSGEIRCRQIHVLLGEGEPHDRRQRKGINLAACIGSVERNREITRSEEHTSELQSLMRTSYAVLCLNKKKRQHTTNLR